ncbi:UDP-glucose 4-epimerase GalE [Marinobacterium sp. BA1]|uniref:UDP-glucose 4-epimerase GalE n=1 Tax=Marinobacterium sp. BA1 TaxID=3138931 RepID=UPI0032E73FAD
MILVTGGAGYIGSHTTLDLLRAGHEVVVLDNLACSSKLSLARVEALTGSRIPFIEGDICNPTVLRSVFSQFPVTAVIHFAGLKAVGESVDRPLYYYENNVLGTINLCRAMSDAGVFKIVFSSSAAVYSPANEMPVRENSLTGGGISPYGRTKLFVESLLQDLAHADPRWKIALLRYFNPVGAHESGLIGEAPLTRPENLFPAIIDVALGRRPELLIHGADYPTPDGTGVRDFIHVMDLAQGHLKALDKIDATSGVQTWNLGTGIGSSVLQLVHAFERASGKPIPYRVVGRRKGDLATCWADPSKAGAELGWKACRTLEDMVADAWRWQQLNPNGY